MGKGGKYMARRKRSAAGLIVAGALCIGILACIFLFLRKETRQPVLPELQKQTPYQITSTLMDFDVQWAQATIWKETGVHLHLTQKQISDIIHGLNRLEESDFEQISVDNTMSVMLHFSDKEILLHYDGQRVGFVFDSATGEALSPGSWSVADPVLKGILDPIADLDNTKQWIGYMTSYDLKNLCLNLSSLTWDFFEDFAYWTVSEEEIKIPVEESHHILVGGSREGRPETLYLVENADSRNRIDIRSSDEDTLLGVFHSPAGQGQQDTAAFLSQEQAMLNGYVVMQDGDARHNQGSWAAFAKRVAEGESASVTVVQYTSQKNGFSYIRYDLSFDGEIYSLNITTEDRQLSCSFTGLKETSGKLTGQADGYDRFIRYTLTGGTDTADVVIFTDLIAQPDLTQAASAALHMKVSEPPLEVFEDPEEVEAILALLREAEYEMVPPDDYVFGVSLILHAQDAEEIRLEVDIRQGVYRYGNNYYRYGELSDLFRVLGISQWPEEVRQEYSSYLY